VTDLTPITALGQAAPEIARFGDLELRENTGLGLASLAMRRGASQPAPFGLTLPQPGGCISSETAMAVWIGPQQWMLAFEGRAEADIVPEVQSQAPDCSVTEQTDGWVAFDISGPDLTALLERLVNVDLSAFGPGSATRTVIDHMGVYLIHGAPGQARIMGMRSSAHSLWHALSTAAARLTKETQK
jgi:sarcosine oxidase subunit gamma